MKLNIDFEESHSKKPSTKKGKMGLGKFDIIGQNRDSYLFFDKNMAERITGAVTRVVLTAAMLAGMAGLGGSALQTQRVVVVLVM